MKGQHLGRHCVVIGRFALGFATAALVVFGFAGAVGVALHHVGREGAASAIGLAGLAAALVIDIYAIRQTKWCPLGLRRQTPQGILYQSGIRRAALAWGIDAGLVFSTYRVSAVSWAAILGCLIGMAPWWTGLAYAGGFLAPFVTASLLGGTVGVAPDRVALALGRRNPSARWVIVVALAGSLGILATSAMT